MLQVIKHQENEFMFELKSESGHTLLRSILFPNKNKAIETARGLNLLINKSSSIERKTNHKGQFLFNFKNGAGKLIGNSQLYNSEAGMENGIKNLTQRINALSNTKHL